MYLKRKRGRTSSKGKTCKALSAVRSSCRSPRLAEWTIVRSAPLSNNGPSRPFPSFLKGGWGKIAESLRALWRNNEAAHSNTGFLRRNVPKNGDSFVVPMKHFTLGRHFALVSLIEAADLFSRSSVRIRLPAHESKSTTYVEVQAGEAASAVSCNGLGCNCAWTARKNLQTSFPSLKVLKPPFSSRLGDGHLMALFAFDPYRTQARTTFAWHGRPMVRGWSATSQFN